MSDVFQVIHSAADIDLNRHAVIEASAGTGKTYTMVALVMRLMADEQNGLPLDKILLTTFTDNAANELKSRIRSQLKQRLSEGGLTEKISLRFETALQHIESAPVFTIHGFCQRMTREFAFESGQIFDQELVDNQRVLEECFNEYVRTWPSDDVAQKAFTDYLSADRKNSLARLKSTVLALARHLKPDFDVIYPLNPEPLADLTCFALSSDLATLKSQFLKLHTNKGGAVNKAMADNWTDRVKPLLLTLSDQQLKHQQKLDYVKKVIHSMADKSCFEYFFFKAPRAFKDDQWHNNTGKYPLICRQLEDVFKLINQIIDQLNYRQSAIVKLCLSHLDQAVTRYLSEQGQVTYDRIIRQLYDILRNEEKDVGQPLTDAIRARYTVAMIDEFQDTDPYQWHLFKHLFLSDPNSPHRLWVIGDPKQSIYGFRGADVNTYYQARSIMQLTGAQFYRLNTNYRSIPALISSFNHFFTAESVVDSPAYWYPKDSIYVAAADRCEHPELPRLERDHSGLAAFNYIPLDGDNKVTIRRFELADLMADTIQSRLIGRLKFCQAKRTKVLDYDDICVLIRSHSDSEIIKKVFKSQQIPVSVQKSRGLYHQPEAIQFEVILSALHQPYDKNRVHNALCTVFFNRAFIEPDRLSETQVSVVNQQWYQLLNWAKSGQWVALFDWLIEASGTRFRAEKSNNSRQLANLEKIANTLCRYAIQNRANCAELLRYYKKLRLTAAQQDEDEQYQDTDHTAVKVMTQHGAKGLEFPVVFIFDGLTNPPERHSYHKFYSESERATVYDISQQSKDLQDITRHKEFKQLYYVALTRAVYKVFVPYLDVGTSYLSKDYQNLIIENIHRCIKARPHLDDLPANVLTASPAGETLTTTQQPTPSTVPFSQSPLNLSARSHFIHSFSSLSRQFSQDFDTQDERHFGESLSHDDEPVRDDLSLSAVPTIPGGVTTGHVLHGIFEHVDFAAVLDHDALTAVWQDSAIMAVVDAQMQLFKMKNHSITQDNQHTGVPADYRQQMAAWVWHTLKKPLPMLSGQALGAIKPQDRRHEMAFHWQHEGHILTGYIDLLFRVDNGQGGDDYFILDWKSNLNAEGYTPQVLKDTVMKLHHYDLQFHLYAAAVETWFQQLNLSDSCLKGALYVFSRGMNCQSDNNEGIFYHAFTDLDQQNKQTRQQLSTLIGTKI